MFNCTILIFGLAVNLKIKNSKKLKFNIIKVIY